jgi:peroxiredoxin family protein
VKETKRKQVKKIFEAKMKEKQPIFFSFWSEQNIRKQNEAKEKYGNKTKRKEKYVIEKKIRKRKETTKVKRKIRKQNEAKRKYHSEKKK